MSISQCTISNLTVDTGECIEANFYNFTFNFNIGDNSSELFDLYLNGEFYDTYELDDLPVTIVEFQGSSSGIDTLLVCSQGNENCCADLLIQSPCTCDYFNVQSTITGCDEDSLWFTLDFDYVNVSDSFLMGTPGLFLGTYHVNQLPLEIGPFPRSLSPAEVLISAQNDIFCFESFMVNDEICDQCLISNVLAAPGECNADGQFYVTLSFEYRNTSQAGFRVQGNGVFYGEYLYEDSILLNNGMYMDSLIIGPFPGDCETSWEFMVLDEEYDACEAFSSIDPVCCEVECDLRDILVNEVECNNAESISFYLDFIYENPGNDFFHVYSGDDHVAMYSLADLPVFIEDFPLAEEGEYVMTVCINDMEDCCAEYVFEEVDCSHLACSVSDIVVDGVECTSTETIAFWVNFEYTNAGNDFFEIYSNEEFVGYFPLDELPILIDDFPIQDGETAVVICINDQNDCCNEYIFADLDCSDFECEIGEIEYEIEYINADSFLVILNFEYNGADPNQFSVHGNGIYYGEYNYMDVPIVLGPYNCHDSLFLEFVVRDLNNPDCQNVLDLGVISCPMNTANQNVDKVAFVLNGTSLQVVDPNNVFENGKLRIFDPVGRKVSEFNYTPGARHNDYDLSPYMPGIYFVELSDGKDRIAKKIVLAR